MSFNVIANETRKSLLNAEDPLDPQLLKNLSLFYHKSDVNPFDFMVLYEECIGLLGISWKPFIRSLADALLKGATVSEYFVIGYCESLKHSRKTESKHQQDSATQVKDQTSQVTVFTKFITDLVHVVESNDLKLSPTLSAEVSKVLSPSTMSTSAALSPFNKFTWEDGKSYRSKMGFLTANRDGSISINLNSSEFQEINVLRTIVLEPEQWELVLNRDLSELTSYLALNSELFKDFNNEDDSKKVERLNDLALHAPVNNYQWITNALEMYEWPKCILPCKLELELRFRMEGCLPTCNLKELIETMCFMVLIDWEKPFNLSKSAKPFLWHFISSEILSWLKFLPPHTPLLKVDAARNVTLRGISEGLCQENSIVTQSYGGGDRSWELTDNCDKYFTIVFSYKVDYSTSHVSERKSLKDNGFMVMKAPSADARARLLRIEAQMVNVKAAEQSEVLKQFLYVKRINSKKP